MSSIQYQNQVQAFCPDRSHPPFSMCIRIGGLISGVNDMDSLGLKNTVEGASELAVIILDQETQIIRHIAEFPE